MASTINADNGVVSGSSGVKTTADTSGVLALQSNGSTALTINTDLSATFAGAVTASSFSGTTTTATNLAGGSNGTIPYQSASGTTQMLAAGTSGQVLTSNGAAAPTWAAVSSGSITATASGTLSNGCVVVVNSDGTVSAGAATTVTLGAGTPATLNLYSVDPRHTCGVLINSTTVVVFYQDPNFGRLTGNVGTISGSTITFGANQVINAGNSYYLSCAYSSSLDRIVVFGRNDGDQQSATVWLVSRNGDTLTTITSNAPWGNYTYINFQTASAFDAAGTNFYCAFVPYTGTYGTYRLNTNKLVVTTNSIQLLNYYTAPTNYSAYGPATLTLDPTSGNFVCTCYDSSSNGYVKVVSASDASTGSQYTYASGGVSSAVGVAYNPTTQKFTIVFRDDSVGGYALGCIVASVSGTTVTFGTKANLAGSIGPCNYFSSTYDSAFDSVDTVFQNSSGGLSFAKITVSGTTPTLVSGPTQLYADGRPATQNNSAFFYTASGKAYMTYLTAGAANLNGVIVSIPGVLTNITSTNLLGFSSGAYTNGQTATVNVVSSTNSAQSGLTAGLKYYAQDDGTLSSSATTKPYAGVALSATKILVKG